MKCPNCKCDLEEVVRDQIRETLAADCGSGFGPLSHITTIYELFEILEYDLDGDGLVITDGTKLANAIAMTFPTLKNDMPQFVKEID